MLVECALLETRFACIMCLPLGAGLHKPAARG